MANLTLCRAKESKCEMVTLDAQLKSAQTIWYWCIKIRIISAKYKGVNHSRLQTWLSELNAKCCFPFSVNGFHIYSQQERICKGINKKTVTFNVCFSCACYWPRERARPQRTDDKMKAPISSLLGTNDKQHERTTERFGRV